MQVVKFGVYNKLDSCGEIEGQWTQVMEKYDMLTNKHVIGLCQINGLRMQYPWITEAISKKLPLTKHAFCI